MRLFLLTFLVFFCLVPTVNAQEKIDVTAWSNLPILHEGRVKPLDSFARVMLKTFSNQENIGDLSAGEWLAFSVFNPAEAIDIRIFKIREFERYSLPENKNRLYSYTDIAQIIAAREDTIKTLMGAKPETWSEDQKQLVELYEYYILYTQILRSLTLILPLNIESENKNFLEYKKVQQNLDQKTKDIVAKKGAALEKYTPEERKITFLSYQLNLLEGSAQNNVLFRILPLNWADKASDWVAPWNIIQSGAGSPQNADYIKLWQDMAGAYREQNSAAWQDAVTKATASFDKPKLKIEHLYNILHLLQVALILYALSFFILIASKLFFTNYKKTFEKIAFGVLGAAVAANGFHILLRVIILGRPPVGTLYESILFVSLLCAAIFAYLSWRQKNGSGILLGSLSGLMLLTTAQGFVSEDTMGTLVAVLNTNFWLGTHVICITVGYSTCFIASLMAHYDLVLRWLKPERTAFFTQSFFNLKTMIILSLLFTTVGTISGGIWADQSWGRFWGWDPKENGALLIVLWLSWLLHGRISGHINQVGFIVGSALLSIIVVLAWFGVNLLNVGLHSYGFISGVATGIALFCVAEILLVGFLWRMGKKA